MARTDITKGRMIMLRAMREQGGFLKKEDIEKIALDETTRLVPCLVRCGGGRFMCAAQDVAHFIEVIEAHGGDYVRDVSLRHGVSESEFMV